MLRPKTERGSDLGAQGNRNTIPTGLRKLRVGQELLEAQSFARGSLFSIFHLIFHID